MKFKKSIIGMLAMLPLARGTQSRGVQRGAVRELGREAGVLSRPKRSPRGGQDVSERGA
jgi:hypothetical protein